MPVLTPEQQSAVELRNLVLAGLGTPPSPSEVLNTMANVYATNEFHYNTWRDGLSEKLRNDIACRSGCHFCCHVVVYTSAPEVFYISESLRSAGGANFEVAINRFATMHNVYGHEDAAQRWANRRPCPALDGKVCAIYGGRPFACRALVSSSYQACADDFSTPPGAPDKMVPYIQRPGMIAAVMRNGMLAAFLERNLRIDTLELNAALSIALQDVTALPRWLAGEDVFAAAKAYDPDSPDLSLMARAMTGDQASQIALSILVGAGKPPQN